MSEKTRDWEQWLRDNPTDDDQTTINKPHVWWLKNKETIRLRIIKNFELNDDYQL